jgi:hypothetical protein
MFLLFNLHSLLSLLTNNNYKISTFFNKSKSFKKVSAQKQRGFGLDKIV